jgi:hypothetical protein
MTNTDPPAADPSADSSPAGLPPAQRLAELLETLSPKERTEITAWLLGRGRQWPFGSLPLARLLPHASGAEAATAGRAVLARTVSIGEDTQLVTIRLPSDRHAELRAWCEDHGFTMAAVVRGLVERFLESQPGTGG